MSRNNQGLTTKTCKICGREFQTTEHRKLVCDDIHTRPCPVCGNPVEFKRPSEPIKCCSKKCTAERRKQTMLERHGVEYAQQSESIRAKSEATSLEKYGTTIPSKSDIVKEHARQTFQKHFGVDTPLVAPGFAEKRRETCLRKYGVEFTGQAKSHIDQMRETCMKKYGGPAPMCNPQIRKLAYKHNGPTSSLEFRVRKWLIPYGFQCEFNYTINKDGSSHEFDIHVPDLKLLIDCDGLLYHG